MKQLLKFLVIILLVITIYPRMISVKVAWDPVTTDTNGNPVTVDRYEVKFINVYTKQEWNYATTSTQIKVLRATKRFTAGLVTGTYEVRVRAVVKNGNEDIYSEWASSLNPDYATPNPWKVKFVTYTGELEFK